MERVVHRPGAWIDANKYPPANGIYLVRTDHGHYYVLEYFHGWNCCENGDGSVYREAEITSVTDYKYIVEDDTCYVDEEVEDTTECKLFRTLGEV